MSHPSFSSSLIVSIVIFFVNIGSRAETLTSSSILTHSVLSELKVLVQNCMAASSVAISSEIVSSTSNGSGIEAVIDSFFFFKNLPVNSPSKLR
jgi:hypothetical protein